MFPEGSRLWALRKVLSGEEPVVRRASSFRFPVNQDARSRSSSRSSGNSTKEAKQVSCLSNGSSHDETQMDATGNISKNSADSSASDAIYHGDHSVVVVLSPPPSLELSATINFDNLNDEEIGEASGSQAGHPGEGLPVKKTVSWSDHSSSGLSSDDEGSLSGS
jgi:hypothetical protein